jgi:hypothetical protein
MLWTGFCSTAEEALDVFARRRTDPRLDRSRLQQVDAPCQRRYVHYVERIVRGHDFTSPRRTFLTSVSLVNPPTAGRRGTWRCGSKSRGGAVSRVTFIVECFGAVVYDHGKRHGALQLPAEDIGSVRQKKDGRREGSYLVFDMEDPPLVWGDVSIRFYSFDEDSVPSTPHGAELGPGARSVRYGPVTGRQFCFVTLHTSFHQDGEVSFPRAEIDGAYNKSERHFPALFTVCLSLSTENSMTSSAQLIQSVLPPPTRPSPSFNLKGMPIAAAAFLRNGSSDSMKTGGEDEMAGHDSDILPYGRGVSRRLIHLFAAVDQIFAAACPSPLVYRRGDHIWSDGDGGSGGGRRLYLIVAGVAEYAPVARDERPPHVNRGDSIARMQASTSTKLQTPFLSFLADRGIRLFRSSY